MEDLLHLFSLIYFYQACASYITLIFHITTSILLLNISMSTKQSKQYCAWWCQNSVKSLANHIQISFQISWIRLRDWHILTTGVLTYTSDSRFQVLHKEGSYDWILQIKYVQERDAGEYDCQVLLHQNLEKWGWL